ncbi:RNA polymerase sigma factor [Nonomuraea sp. NPDC050663]|uniref:RNA polymerase sigma factor n=1 Tax=Nonomuraea sp. NPDC050663 TaxID=3364370 RepID=UPI003797E9CA
MTDLGVVRPLTSTALYHEHAAGLFAYCADQLGDQGSALDALMAVMAREAERPPPRAALYALARREIHRRDVVYAPPVVDPLVDPAFALVERAFRDLRPHQREVLLLCEVCGLDRIELAWVLDVAADTADELAANARTHFQHALHTAITAISVRLVTAAHDVLRIAPLSETLRRLPWPAPPESTYEIPSPAHVVERAAIQRWPLTPTWPLPLAETDPLTNTGLFPAELLAPRTGKAEHEATTAPMPKVRDDVVLSAPVKDDVRTSIKGILGSLQKTFETPVPTRAEPGDVLVAGAPEDSLFQPKAAPPEPVYIMPEEPEPEPEPVAVAEERQEPVRQEARPSKVALSPERPKPAARPRHYPRHHDWAWELIGFVICVAIAMVVFFAIPTISG